MSKSSARVRRELLEATRKRYLVSSPPEKRKILDELVALTGYHRKHAIRVLRAPMLEPVSRSRRPRLYGEAVREALVVLWEASNRICGKRLKPLLPVLVPALESRGHLSLDAAVRGRVLAASPATIDRLLAGYRTAAPVRRRTRRTSSAAARHTPAPTFAGGEPTQPGHLRFDETGEPHHAVPPPTSTLEQPLHSAATAPDDALRPTQRAAPKPPRHWRTRVDAFEEVWPRVVTWLELEPDRTAKELLQRLRDEGFGEFPDRQLRTLQRRVKAWRRAIGPARSP